MNIKLRRNNLSIKQKKIISFAVILLFIAFCSFIGWYIGRPIVQFVSDPEKFRAWVNEHGIWGDISFILMTVFQVVIAFVPGEPFEIGAGYAFGAFKGTILCIMGITLGSILTFLLVRKLGVHFVEIFFTESKIKTLKFLQNERKMGLIIFLIFFLPGTPKDLITYFVGLTDIKPSHYLLLVSIARLPSIVTSTLGGNALGTENYITATFVFIITAIFSGMGLLLYNLYTKHKSKKER